MENEACAEEKICDVAVEKVKEPPVATSPYRYTKEELLEIKELPCSNERPECLADKYDSDGVWDPEKWHASLYPTSERSSPVEGFKKDYLDDRVPLKRRIPDPRERLKEDDLDVVLSPQRRSFGGGCQGNAAPAPLTRRPISPLENKENESLRLGVVRRIGSGRIIPARAFEREARMERERERDFKDKRFRQRDFGDKRVFSERRRNDSYAEEEPEWFSGGPTRQSETIELIGFDDKILEDDKRRSKRSRRRTESVKEECNGLAEEPDVGRDSTADQEVPHPEVLPEQSISEAADDENRRYATITLFRVKHLSCYFMIFGHSALQHFPVQSRNMARLHDLIQFYFKLGLRHGEILQLLSTVDGIVLSMRTLRRILKSMGLYRRKNESDPLDVASFLIDPLSGHGRLHIMK